MTIQSIRFRVEGEQVVLQVLENARHYDSFAYNERGEWRDAKVTDLLEVARYTRAYDALDSTLSNLNVEVSGLHRQVSEVLEMNRRSVHEHCPRDTVADTISRLTREGS
jgi:hypothetical protein